MGGNRPEGKYSAESIQRVARMRMRTLKNGSPGTLQASRESASVFEEVVSRARCFRILSMSFNASKLLGGGAACRLRKIRNANNQNKKKPKI